MFSQQVPLVEHVEIGLLRLLDVVPQGLLEPRHVAGLDELQHLPVVVDRQPVQPNLVGETRAQRLDPEPDLAVGVADEGVAAQIDHGLVVRAVEGPVGDRVVGVERRPHGAVDFGHPRDERPVAALDGAPRCGGFEDFPQLADHHDLVRGEPEDIGPPLGRHVDETLELELQERFPHRRLRDAELGRERILGERLPEPQAAVDDARAQFVDNEFRQGFWAHELHGLTPAFGISARLRRLWRAADI